MEKFSETYLLDITIPNAMGSQKSNYGWYNIQKSRLITRITMKGENVS
jgi:hypothetical protein